MSINRINDLEREFGFVNFYMAHPFDLADRAQLRERRAAIIEEVREIVRRAGATEPEWCRIPR
jgi:hypothetical protein